MQMLVKVSSTKNGARGAKNSEIVFISFSVALRFEQDRQGFQSLRMHVLKSFGYAAY